jgi:hypothetical protein
MASATLKELTKAPTMSPPIDINALPEHSRNIRYKAPFPETVLNIFLQFYDLSEPA